MSCLYRAINEAALAQCRTKNEAFVVIALSNQTFGYGKVSDPLTDKRLSQLTHIRLDRLRVALNAVIKKGIFERKSHRQFGYEYSIGKTFLATYQGKVYTPSIPKNSQLTENENPQTRTGQDLTQMGANLPENRTHTVTNTDKPLKKPQQQKNSVPLAEQSSIKLCFTDIDQIPTSFAIETANANTRIEFAFGETTPDATTLTQSVTKPAPKPVPEPRTTSAENMTKLRKILDSIRRKKSDNIEQLTKKPITASRPEKTTSLEPWQQDALEAADYLERMETEKAATQTTTAVCCGNEKDKKQQPQQQPRVKVPESVGEENLKACYNHLQTLPDDEQKKVVLVFNYNVKTRTISNKVGYFISLIQAAKTDSLTVPTEAIVKQPPTAEKIAAEKERERRVDLWSDFTWLQDNSAWQKIDMATLAKQMGSQMEAAYAMFA